MVCDCCCVSTLIYGLSLLTLVKLLWSFVKRFVGCCGDKCRAPLEQNWEKDTVYLYQYNGTPKMSSVSPFCVKVEAYLRLHSIPYKRRYTTCARGKNSKLPMIELNGEQICDSQIIIMRLQEKFEIKDYANEHDAAVGHAVDRMVDLQTFNLLCTYKDMELCMKAVIQGCSVSQSIVDLFMPIIKCVVSRKTAKRVEVAIGSFSSSEKETLLKNDFKRLTELLGDKPFLFGDKPTLADCGLFGQLSTLYYLQSGGLGLPYDLLDRTEYAPLKEYIVRVKDQLFGDEFHM